MSDNFDIPTNLGSIEDYPSWHQHILRSAASAPIPDLQYGLVHLVVSPATYLAYPGVAGPINIQRPAALAGGAAGGTVATYKEQLDLFLLYTRLTKLLQKAIIDSLSPALQRDITDAATNIILMDCYAIMLHMENLFGVPNAASVDNLMSKLMQPLLGQDMTTFIDHTSQFNIVLAELQRAGQPLSAYEQMTRFTDTVSTQPAAFAAIQRFVQINPNLAARTLPNLIVYVREQLANVTAAAGGYANAAVASPITPTLVQDIVTAMRNQGLVVSSSPAAGKGPLPGRSPRNMTHYCYKHGYGHKGSVCTVMLGNNKFTAAMRNARSPSDVAGGHT